MTIDEFNNTKWSGGMFAMYRGQKFPIASCIFDEALVGLDGVTLGSDEPTWVRCESIELVSA